MTLHSIPALVLAAGRGTRLHPLSCVRAKPTLPVAGTPLVRRILARLARSGVRRVVVNLHHRPESVTRCVGDGADLGLAVRYSWEPRLLGSAGGPRRALPLLAADRFFIVNGDTLSDVDFAALLRAHRESGALVTMAVVPMPGGAGYGGVVADAGGWVRSFARAGDPAASWHFVGVQVAEAAAFASLPDDRPAETVARLYPALLAARPRAIRVFAAGSGFRDIGTPADYLATFLDVARGEGLTELPMGARSKVEPSARVDRTAIWDDATIEAGCELVECIVTDGVRVPPGTRLLRKALVRAAGCPGRTGDERKGDLLISPLERPRENPAPDAPPAGTPV